MGVQGVKVGSRSELDFIASVITNLGVWSPIMTNVLPFWDSERCSIRNDH